MSCVKNKKFQHLVSALKGMRSILLAYSGGVDSTFLLKAVQASGVNALAVSASSALIPSREVQNARGIAKELGVRHRIVDIDVLLSEEVAMNTPERCFFCKEMLFKELRGIAHTEAYEFILDGGTRDDLNEFRPGRKASQIYGVRSPLMEAGYTKNEIREMSRLLGLATWDRASSPCLATRFPYGRRITIEALRRVEMSESFLRTIGFRQLRVRDHGDSVRIEVTEEDMGLFLDPGKRTAISAMLKSFGYLFISLDLDGYRSGSMDRVLKNIT